VQESSIEQLKIAAQYDLSFIKSLFLMNYNEKFTPNRNVLADG